MTAKGSVRYEWLLLFLAYISGTLGVAVLIIAGAPIGMVISSSVYVVALILYRVSCRSTTGFD